MWCKFKTLEAKRLTAEARASGRFKNPRSKIGIRPDGSELVKLFGEDWDKLRVEVFERDGWKCVDCNKKAWEVYKLDPSHNIPRGHGGSDVLSNVHTRCRDCHNRKDERDLRFGKVKQA
jgi:hypothetical protein